MADRYLTTREAAAYLAELMPDPPARQTMETWAAKGRVGGPAPGHLKTGWRVWWSTAELRRWAGSMPADWKGRRAGPGIRPDHP